ncbi:hypothetical protein [Amycolatopsis thailandensis]|uniref:hypothetical protein n=1 Tax=Amycolatopsis thailandensis TaxID=589330 RepID=UPI003631E7BE
MPLDPDAVLVFHDPAESGHSALVAKLVDRLDVSARAGAKPVPVQSAASSTDPAEPFSADLTAPLTPLPRLSALLRRSETEQSSERTAVALAVEDDEVDEPVETTKIRHPAAEVEAEAVVDEPDVTTKIGHPALEDDGTVATTKIHHPGLSLPAFSAETAKPLTSLQPTPEPGHRAWPVPSGFDAERALIRAGREEAFDELSGRIAATWRRFSSNRPLSEAGLTEMVAAGLYLAGEDPDVDAKLRAAGGGPHVEFARCVAAGLHRLPVHRNAAADVVFPDPDLWTLLGSGTVLREWGFLNLLTVPGTAAADATDLVAWSASGRLTALIESKEEGLANRVVFLPGTAFKVLEAVEPAEGRRGRILVRELVAAELGEDGKSVEGKTRDNLILTSLRRFADRVAGARPAGSRGARRPEFGWVPGVTMSRKDEQ